MVRNTAVSGNDGRGRFARPPWTKKSSEWRRIDARIADGHLAHHVNQAVELLDLTPLFDSYLGVGKEAIRPDLLLKLVLYEVQPKTSQPVTVGAGYQRERATALARVWSRTVTHRTVPISRSSWTVPRHVESTSSSRGNGT